MTTLGPVKPESIIYQDEQKDANGGVVFLSYQENQASRYQKMHCYYESLIKKSKTKNELLKEKVK